MFHWIASSRKWKHNSHLKLGDSLVYFIGIFDYFLVRNFVFLSLKPEFWLARTEEESFVFLSVIKGCPETMFMVIHVIPVYFADDSVWVCNALQRSRSISGKRQGKVLLIIWKMRYWQPCRYILVHRQSKSWRWESFDNIIQHKLTLITFRVLPNL